MQKKIQQTRYFSLAKFLDLLVTPERWQRIEELYHSAREQSPDERANWLTDACVGDDALRHEIEALLKANEQAEEFLTGHALGWESES